MGFRNPLTLEETTAAAAVLVDESADRLAGNLAAAREELAGKLAGLDDDLAAAGERLSEAEQRISETFTAAGDAVSIAGAAKAAVDEAVENRIDGQDAVLLRVSSSRGTQFKNNAIATVLTVTVITGSTQITDLTALWETFGQSAYLEWWWRRPQDTEFGVISSADPRLSQSGFALTISPNDVDDQAVFQCVLHT